MGQVVVAGKLNAAGFVALKHTIEETQEPLVLVLKKDADILEWLDNISALISAAAHRGVQITINSDGIETVPVVAVQGLSADDLPEVSLPPSRATPPPVRASRYIISEVGRRNSPLATSPMAREFAGIPYANMEMMPNEPGPRPDYITYFTRLLCGAGPCFTPQK